MAAGFSIIELLVVLAVIGILSAISFGMVRVVSERTRTNRAITQMTAITQGLEQFKNQYGDYPFIRQHTAGAEARGQDLYRALSGQTGPLGHFFPRQGRAFINPDQFFLANTGTVSPDRIIEDQNTFLEDPWGRPYEYFYKTENNPDNWENPQFVLFSRGPDGGGKANDPGPDGRPDYDHSDNRRVIFANRH